MKVCTKLMDTSFTMCTHAVDALMTSWELAPPNAVWRAMHICRDWLCRIWAWFLCRLLFDCFCFVCFFCPLKRILHCFQEQLFFLGSVLSNDVAWNTSPMKVGAGVGVAKGCCVGAGLWRRQSSLWCFGGLPVLYHAQGTEPGRLMGKEGYHQRMHLISIKMTLFPN